MRSEHKDILWDIERRMSIKMKENLKDYLTLRVSQGALEMLRDYIESAVKRAYEEGVADTLARKP